MRKAGWLTVCLFLLWMPLLVRAQDSLAVQSTPCHWNVRLGVGWFGPAFHSAWYPNITADGEYLFPYGIRAGVQASYFHRSMPSGNPYDAFSVSLRASVYIKALLGNPDPRWDFYAGTGAGCHWFRYGAVEQAKGQFFVPVYIGTKVKIAPFWHLSLEIAYNDASGIRLGASREF